MPIRVGVRVEGFTQLVRKLRTDVLLAPALTSAMQAGIQDAARIVEGRAPKRSGRLAASIQTNIDKHPVPTWARVQVTARSRSKKYPRGYRYPRLLEYSAKLHHERWFRGSITPAKSAMARHVEAAKRTIERIWAA
jgi:hypothetical protein